ncbi:olfactory receptor-like protein DTMT [Clarias gariepinus]|uniref:olfactory receptor-like protein DTMT n=1 Tax=Clarias gariepinus TaxID=13013 RepID=UPI00234C8C80|nr:olfactory receptor-like protein DTMT [Clarias gariepinus]
MDNTSGEFNFLLYGLNDSKTNRYIYFSFGLAIYIITLFINMTLIITIILDKTLHEPMYLLICNLYVNGICGASAFYPKILADLLSDYQIISYKGCMSQIYIIYVYAFCEFTCLTIMAYDRYVAICKPLEYHCIITQQKVMKLLVFTWLFTLLETSVGTARLPLCGNNIDKLYCFNWGVVKLSCTDITLNNLYGYVLIVTHVSQSFVIIVSYVYIIRASLHSRIQWFKFMQTCLPHLIALVNFTISLLFDALCARYCQGQQALSNILGMMFLVVPPLLNPIIYGMKQTQIRHALVKMYRGILKCWQQH